jgi:hypothetical protein
MPGSDAAFRESTTTLLGQAGSRESSREAAVTMALPTTSMPETVLIRVISICQLNVMDEVGPSIYAPIRAGR